MTYTLPSRWTCGRRRRRSALLLVVCRRFLHDHLDQPSRDWVLISPERRDPLALSLQDLVDQLTRSLVLAVGDATDRCPPIPHLVPRIEHQVVAAAALILHLTLDAGEIRTRRSWTLV